jgi:hypothetical protein
MHYYTTIIVGNGLGMALDPSHFTLQSGLSIAWANLDLDTQLRIKQLVTNGDNLLTEEQLEKHYGVIHACTMLQRYESTDLNWLDPRARDFPYQFQKFIENTAWHFFQYDNLTLMENFVKHLKHFIQHNHTHLVTLNYDKLIYSSFVNDDEIMNGYHGELVDGFYRDGFRPHQLIRQFDNHFGWYLHLHGSPLFYTCPKTNLVKKSLLTDTYDILQNQGIREHIVLCSYKLKATRIQQSDLLSTYWHYFLAALNESNKIIVLGYSGNDQHINFEINRWLKDTKTIKGKSILVVEYKDEQDSDLQRRQFWSSKFGEASTYFNSQNLLRLPSILNYLF